MLEEGASFEFRHIHISLVTGSQEVIALVRGPLAVCQAQTGEWRLCHVATGYRVLSFQWWDDAIRAAARLSGLDWTNAADRNHPDHLVLGAEVRRVYAEVLAESASQMYDPAVEGHPVVPTQ